MSANLVRAFIAVEIPEELKSLLVELRKSLDLATSKIRWSDPGAIHLTLKFLGDVEEARIPEVVAGCGRAAEAAPGPAGVSVGALAPFPSADNPKVISAVVEPDRGLLDLQAAVEAEMEALGFPSEERGYHPHITVGRIKSDRSKRRAPLRIEGAGEGRAVGRFTVNELVVFRSELTPGGAVHTPMGRAPLVKG